MFRALDAILVLLFILPVTQATSANFLYDAKAIKAMGPAKLDLHLTRLCEEYCVLGIEGERRPLSEASPCVESCKERHMALIKSRSEKLRPFMHYDPHRSQTVPGEHLKDAYTHNIQLKLLPVRYYINLC